MKYLPSAALTAIGVNIEPVIYINDSGLRQTRGSKCVQQVGADLVPEPRAIALELSE